MTLPVFTDPVTKEPSFSLTVAAITFAVVMVRWCVGGLTLWGHQFAQISDASINTWLTPTLIFYTARKMTGAAENVALLKVEGGKVP